MAIEELGIRLRADGVVETTNGTQLAGKAVEDLGNKADAAAKKVDQLEGAQHKTGAGAQVLGTATQQVVGQLTNMLPVPGAVGNALGSMGQSGAAAMTSLSGSAIFLAGGLATAAGAAFVLTRAWMEGSAEARAYNQAIQLTGNAVGTTSDQLADLARNIAAGVGTQGQSAAVLAQLAGTASVASAELQNVATAAIRMERLVGTSASETVRQFAELGKDPVKASVKLNETTNYLTRSVYEQIRALAEQGRTAAAAGIAQQAYADALKPRLDSIENNLSTLQRRWLDVKDAAKGAWDSMLGIGRQATLTQQISTIEAQINALDTRRSNNPGLTAQRRQVLIDQLDALKKTERLSRLSAETQRAETASVREYIAAREQKNKPAGGAARDPYDGLNESIQRRLALAAQELEFGGKLTQADVFRIETLRQIDAAEKLLGKTRADGLRKQVEGVAQIMQLDETQRDAERAKQRSDELERRARAEAVQAAEREAKTIEQQRDALANQTGEIGLNAAAIVARRQAQLDAQIAEKQAELQLLASVGGYDAQTAAIQRQIDALQSIRGLEGSKAQKTVEAEEARANAKRTEQLAASIEDGLLNGFRNGKGAADIFLTELKAQFAKTVLSPVIKPIAEAGSSLISKGISLLTSFFGFHGGGVGASEASFTRGVPRFHSGIGPDEIPAVIQRTEGVFTKGQMAAMAPVESIKKAAGPTVTFSPNIYIDSRTDQAQILQLVGGAMTQAQADLLEKMARGQV